MLTCWVGWLASVGVSIVELNIRDTTLVRCSSSVADSGLHGRSGPEANKNEQRWEAERRTARVRNAPVRIPT